MSDFTANRQPPHSDDAERALLGAILMTPRQVLREIRYVLGPQDFYTVRHQTIFAAATVLGADGGAVDISTVAERLKANQQLGLAGGNEYLIDLMASTPAVTNATAYADIIVKHSLARRTIAVGLGIAERGYNLDDPGEIAAAGQVDLGFINTEAATSSGADANLHRMEDFVAADHKPPPWVIPGMFRQRWRHILIAPEGAGKTVLMRQIGVCAAAGVHPFTMKRIPAQKVLIIDVENPSDAVVDTMRPLMFMANKTVPEGWNKDNLMFWHYERGVNLRSRVGQAQFIDLFEKVRPNLVLMGPLYKLSRRGGGDFEQEANEVQDFLDQMRAEFSFALMIEHHMPSVRDDKKPKPKGSALWQHWPEMGHALMKQSPTQFRLMRWRDDRVRNTMPWNLARDMEPLGSNQEPSRWPWRIDTQFPAETEIAETSTANIGKLGGF